MTEKYYLVDLRCGKCGLIFAQTSDPVPERKVEEYENMFREKGPLRFQQCRNKCPRTAINGGIILPAQGPYNYNQKIVRTHIPAMDLEKMEGERG